MLKQAISVHYLIKNLIKNLFDFVYRVNNNDFGVEFKYDFVSIARSFLYEYSDSYILEIITNNNFKETSIYKELADIFRSCKNLVEIGESPFFHEKEKITSFGNLNILNKA